MLDAASIASAPPRVTDPDSAELLRFQLAGELGSGGSGSPAPPDRDEATPASDAGEPSDAVAQYLRNTLSLIHARPELAAPPVPSSSAAPDESTLADGQCGNDAEESSEQPAAALGSSACEPAIEASTATHAQASPPSTSPTQLPRSSEQPRAPSAFAPVQPSGGGAAAAPQPLPPAATGHLPLAMRAARARRRLRRARPRRAVSW